MLYGSCETCLHMTVLLDLRGVITSRLSGATGRTVKVAQGVQSHAFRDGHLAALGSRMVQNPLAGKHHEENEVGPKIAADPNPALRAKGPTLNPIVVNRATEPGKCEACSHVHTYGAVRAACVD